MQPDNIEGIYDPLKQAHRFPSRQGHRPRNLEHPREGRLRPWHVRLLQWLSAFAAKLQRDCALRRPGGGKRKGSFAMCLKPWHADVVDFSEVEAGPSQRGGEGSRFVLLACGARLVHIAG